MSDIPDARGLYEEMSRLQDIFSRIAADMSDRSFGSCAADERTDALQQVLDTTRDILEAEKCALFLVDISRRSLILERASGAVQFGKLKDVGTYDIGQYNPDLLGTGVTPWVWYRRQPFNAKSFKELVCNSQGHWKGNWDTAMYGSQEKVEVDFKCVHMVPLLAGDDCIGVLKYENRTGAKEYFDDSDERLIDMIGALVTNLIVAQQIERNRYDRILPTISEVLVSSFGQSAFYERLLEQCRHILSADLCSLFLVDSQGNLALRAIVGPLSETELSQLTDFRYENYLLSRGLTPWILRTARSFNVRSFPDLRTCSDGNHVGKWDYIVYHGRPQEEFKSLYSIPLIVGNNRIGVLKVENKNIPPFYFTVSDETLFDLIGRLIAIGSIYDNEKYFGALVRGAELGFLAAGISHEFQNYLQRFTLIVANISNRCADNPKLAQKLSDLQHEIGTAAKVIDSFHDIRNRQESTQPFDPDELVDDVLALCRRRFEAYNIEAKYRNEGVGRLHLNPADFQTILVNLMKNAFESIGERSKQGIVQVTLRQITAKQFCLVVEDSGQGITEEQKDHLFLPFFTTKSPSGMGFGLYSVQRIVNANGGEIKTTGSNKLGGASFEITLPISPETTRSTR